MSRNLQMKLHLQGIILFCCKKPLIQFAARYVIRVPGYLKGISSVNVSWQQLH